MDEKEQGSFDDLMRQVFGRPPQEDVDLERADLSEEGYALADAEDLEILMHRDAHFGGSFELMLDYYERGEKGVAENIFPERIEQLAYIQTQTGQDLAEMLLSGAEAERVARARQTYQALRDLYEVESPKSRIPRLIADLILAENEEAEEEIQAVVEEGKAIVPSLLQLLQAAEFYDPLYPGYGQAPFLAARCLGLIGDPQAVPALFEAIDATGFFGEEEIFHALYDIGPKAKEFLLKVLSLRPITHDNEKAARALTHFALDPEVAHVCLEQLETPDAARHTNLAAYLVLCCEGLSDPADRSRFRALVNRMELQHLHQDIEAVARSWSESR